MHRLALGLLAGVIAHIGVVLTWPFVVAPLAFDRLRSTVVLNEMTPIEGAEPALAKEEASDPLFESFACRLDAKATAVVVNSGDAEAPFWTVSVRGRFGGEMFSANSGLSAHPLDLIVATPAHQAASAGDVAEAAPQALIADVTSGEALVVVRVFQPDSTWSGVTRRFVNGLGCRPLDE